MIGELPPALIFIIGAVLLPLVAGRWQVVWALAVPVFGLLNLLYLPDGDNFSVQLLDFTLEFGRVDKLSFLFGVLYQGGAELAFELPRISREMTTAIQGLIILFSGALAYMMRGVLERAWRWLALHMGAVSAPAKGEDHG